MIALTQNGISITYNCYNLRYSIIPFHKKCPDYASKKCYTCKYCKAEMSAYDATRLLNVYKKSIVQKREL